MSERLADVRRLVEAARRVAENRSLRERLAESTGLSRQGVELALRECLETSPDEDDLRELIERAGTEPHVHVVLSSNVFVGALRALALARAASPRVTVSPSRREPFFAHALVNEAGDPAVSIDRAVTIEAIREGAVHVYGRDETVEAVRRRARRSVSVRGFGAGVGVALYTGHDSVDVAAIAIARDVVPFDQRGCLSPRIVIAFDARRAEALCVSLDRALEALEGDVPRGKVDPEETAAAARYACTTEFSGRVWRGKTHIVGMADAGGPLTLPPTGRHLHVAVAEGVEDARTQLAPLQPYIVAVGSDAEVAAGKLLPGPRRISSLGKMQRPPLDGPVDLRGCGA